MDGRAGVGIVQLSQQALLDLEHSKVPPVELLDEVAQILGVKYGQIHSTFFRPDRGKKPNIPAASCAPKEEWILRWLLKRTGLSSAGGKTKVSKENCLHMRLDDRSWLLFLYLVHTVPGQALARIFIEGDFLSNLDACLRDGDHALGIAPAKPDGPDSARSTPETKTKKRKRDGPDRATMQDSNQRPTPDALPDLLATSVCVAIKHCMESSTANVNLIASGHINIALAASPRIAASVTGRLISIFVAILSQEPLGLLNVSAPMEFLPGLLGLWEHRTKEDANPSEGESDREFTDQCLSPCLAFVQVLKSSRAAAGYGQILKKIERFIALHSILPARTRFLTQKPGRIVNSGEGRTLIDLSTISEKLAPLLFDMAVRTVPRNTIRRQQHEQPWLEALFSRLAISCGDNGLQELLEVILAQKINLPQDEIGKLALRQFSNANLRWHIVVQLLQIDASAFLKSSSPLMERLCDFIAESGEEEYGLIRDSVVTLLMRAAAQTRGLQDYVYIWQARLSEAFQEDASSPQHRGSRVWQDPDVFAAFADILRTNAMPHFVHKLLCDSLEHLKNFETDEESMFTALSWTAIVSSVVTSRAKDCAAEPCVLRQLAEVAAEMYTHIRCPDSQCWRLLRLVRQILATSPDTEDDMGLIPIMNFDQVRYPSLGDWRETKQQLRVIEYFHFLVCCAVARPHRYPKLLRKEFEHLIELLEGLCDQPLGHSSYGLADASLGIILQNAEVLRIAPMETLWPALWRYGATSQSTTSQRLFEALVSSDTVTSDYILLSQCFQIIHDSIAGDEAHRSHFAYKLLLSMPCQNIKRSHERTKLVKLLEAAGVASVAQDLTSVPSNPETNSRFEELKSLALETLARSGGRLHILDADSFERLCLELDQTRLTLDTPNQHQVDDLLSTLTSMTAPNAPTFTAMPKNGPAAIYQRLCSLTSLLLTRHRKRLGGRYHLLLPLLQGLLRCLFRPIPLPASSKHPQIRSHHPPWLAANPTTTEPLASRSATQLTRLLTSLCDPTASSVKKHRSRHASTGAGLTDDTKKAKSIAGQYMQYLVMEYTRCQLQGQLPPKVKAALMPGLYAVLDVMSRDLMRGMNAAMDSSSRAIFKGLYDDYQRFGRWNQN